MKIFEELMIPANVFNSGRFGFIGDREFGEVIKGREMAFFAEA